MFSQPQMEHQWLDRLVGTWSFEHECTMPDGATNRAEGTIKCRSLGGLWLICESSGGSPDEGCSSIMTLGFDPAKNQYVGTFIGSMMAHLWPYHGVLDATGQKLPLESSGPKFVGEGTCKYRDTIEIVDRETWLFTSDVQSDDGGWVPFMFGKNVRVS